MKIAIANYSIIFHNIILKIVCIFLCIQAQKAVLPLEVQIFEKNQTNCIWGVARNNGWLCLSTSSSYKSCRLPFMFSTKHKRLPELFQNSVQMCQFWSGHLSAKNLTLIYTCMDLGHWRASGALLGHSWPNPYVNTGMSWSHSESIVQSLGISH